MKLDEKLLLLLISVRLECLAQLSGLLKFQTGRKTDKPFGFEVTLFDVRYFTVYTNADAKGATKIYNLASREANSCPFALILPHIVGNDDGHVATKKLSD